MVGLLFLNIIIATAQQRQFTIVKLSYLSLVVIIARNCKIFFIYYLLSFTIFLLFSLLRFSCLFVCSLITQKRLFVQKRKIPRSTRIFCEMVLSQVLSIVTILNFGSHLEKHEKIDIQYQNQDKIPTNYIFSESLSQIEVNCNIFKYSRHIKFRQPSCKT